MWSRKTQYDFHFDFFVRKRSHEAAAKRHIYTHTHIFAHTRALDPAGPAPGLSIAFNAIRKQANLLIKRTQKITKEK